MNTRAVGIFIFVDLLIVLGIVVYFTNEESTDVVPIAKDEANQEDSEEEGFKLREVSLDEIRVKLEANPQASAQIKVLTELLYTDFLNGIELATDTKAELRTLLTESFMEDMARTQYAIKDSEIPWSEVTSWGNDEKSYLNDQLKGLLSGNDYAKWDDYT